MQTKTIILVSKIISVVTGVMAVLVFSVGLLRAGSISLGTSNILFGELIPKEQELPITVLICFIGALLAITSCVAFSIAFDLSQESKWEKREKLNKNVKNSKINHKKGNVNIDTLDERGQTDIIENTNWKNCEITKNTPDYTIVTLNCSGHQYKIKKCMELSEESTNLLIKHFEDDKKHKSQKSNSKNPIKKALKHIGIIKSKWKTAEESYSQFAASDCKRAPLREHVISLLKDKINSEELKAIKKLVNYQEPECPPQTTIENVFVSQPCHSIGNLYSCRMI